MTTVDLAPGEERLPAAVKTYPGSGHPHLNDTAHYENILNPINETRRRSLQALNAK